MAGKVFGPARVTSGRAIQGGKLVWEWNKTDITQFVASTPQFYTAGAGTSALSVVATSERGNVLRITGVGTTMGAIWLATYELPFETDRRDMVIEYELFTMTPGAGGYAGVAFCCDVTGSFYGLAQMMNSAGAEGAFEVDAGVYASTGATGAGSGDTGFSIYTVRGSVYQAKPPEICSYARGHWSAATAGRRTGAAANRAGTPSFNAGGSLPAGWNGLACKRFGLSIASSGGNPAPNPVDILDMRVYLLS